MKILTLSTFPISEPRSGGQHRVHNIAAFYESLGHEVFSAGVLDENPHVCPAGFVPFPPKEALSKFAENLFFIEDWAIGKLFATSDKYFSALRACIPFAPDLINIEHPWLFAFAQRFANSLKGDRPFLLYGSANIEHQLKHSLLSNFPSKTHADEARELVLACEIDALKHANGFCCVSEYDLTWATRFGEGKAVLAPNGVKKRSTTIEGIEKANKITKHRKFALYCASSHLPNITGFFDIFSEGIGSIAPDEYLVIVGGVGRFISADAKGARISGLHSRTIFAGEVDEECLQGLLEVAHAIILPVTSGGGTNLKTAEALWAKKHVVATTKAMRGFEFFSPQAGITVQDEPEKFQHSLMNAMDSAEVMLTAEEAKSREKVLWASTLAPLNELLKQHQGRMTQSALQTHS